MLSLLTALLALVAPQQLFAYDMGKPLDIKVNRVSTSGGARIADLTYASATRGRVPAYLVSPIDRPITAAVEYGHWSLGDRNEFLPEATAMARYGMVSHRFFPTHLLFAQHPGPVRNSEISPIR